MRSCSARSSSISRMGSRDGSSASHLCEPARDTPRRSESPPSSPPRRRGRQVPRAQRRRAPAPAAARVLLMRRGIRRSACDVSGSRASCWPPPRGPRPRSRVRGGGRVPHSAHRAVRLGRRAGLQLAPACRPLLHHRQPVRGAARVRRAVGRLGLGEAGPGPAPRDPPQPGSHGGVRATRREDARGNAAPGRDAGDAVGRVLSTRVASVAPAGRPYGPETPVGGDPGRGPASVGQGGRRWPGAGNSSEVTGTPARPRSTRSFESLPSG